MNLARSHLMVSGLLLAACLLCVSAAYGQPGTALAGKVLDPSGGNIPGAAVTLFSDDQVVTTKADANGQFVFPSLPLHVRFIEASFNGFSPVSIPVADEPPERVSFTLWPGEGSGIFVPYDPEICPPSTLISYQERTGKIQLAGTVDEPLGSPLPGSVLTLVKADLSAPLATGQDMRRGVAMTQRSFKMTVVAQVISDEEGEFQFTDLEPGLYKLQAAHIDYSDQTMKFWVARENLTALSRIYLVLKGKARGGAVFCATMPVPEKPTK